MPDDVNRQILLASRPDGAPTPDNFSLVESAIPVPGDGEFLCRIVYTSIDPYMRGRMSDAKSYTAPTGIGDVMGGGSVGQVVASRVDGFAAGDFVLTYNGWQEYAVNGPKGVRKLDPAAAQDHDRSRPRSACSASPGMTAYRANEFGCIDDRQAGRRPGSVAVTPRRRRYRTRRELGIAGAGRASSSR